MDHKETDNIDAYVRDIERYSLIDRKEERRLALLIRDGGEAAKAARDQLVCANLRLVVKIAHTFKQYGLPLADLVAEGNIGLIRAAGKFDPDNGAKFSVYAAWWIKQAMRVAVAERTRTVRIPRNTGLRIAKLHRARSMWIAEHGEEPDTDCLSRLTGLSAGIVDRLLGTPDGAVSMDAHTDASDDSSPTYEAALSSSMCDDRESRDERRRLVDGAVARLSDLDRELVTGTYWGNGQEDIAALAMRVGLSVDAARRRLADALGRLRAMLDLEAPAEAFG